MRFDNRKIVLSPAQVESLPEFAPLNVQQKKFVLLLAGAPILRRAYVLEATRAVYECKDALSVRALAYELMRRRSLQPLFSKMFGGERAVDKAEFVAQVDALVRRGHKVSAAEVKAIKLCAMVNDFLTPDRRPLNDEVPDYLAEANYREAKRKFETAYLKKQIEAHGWNVSKTAATVGLQRSSLQKKLKDLGIHRPVGEIEND